jgi:putative spermidine/putrescine transport system permease protein
MARNLPSAIATPRWRGAWLPLFGTLVLFLLMLPTVIVIPMSFSDSSYLEFPPQQWSLRWYREYFGSEQWMSATWTSLQVAVLTTLIATPLGTVAAYGMSSLPARLRNGLQLIVLMPLVVPVILVAVGVFHLYAKLGLNYTVAGVVLAHVALALPFVVITVMSGLKGYDHNLELAARSLGATRARAFLTITVPHLRFFIQTGAFLAFITSLDEVVVAMFVSGGENATITRRMFNALRDQIDPTIAAISTCLIAVSVLSLALVQVLASRQKAGR